VGRKIYFARGRRVVGKRKTSGHDPKAFNKKGGYERTHRIAWSEYPCLVVHRNRDRKRGDIEGFTWKEKGPTTTRWGGRLAADPRTERVCLNVIECALRKREGGIFSDYFTLQVELVFDLMSVNHDD